MQVNTPHRSGSPELVGPLKLYIVTRCDLSPGLQAAQAVHAAFSFAHEHVEPCRSWHEDSNFVVILAAQDEIELLSYWQRLEHVPCRMLVREPDIHDEATAFAVLGADAGRILSALPLALKESAMI